MNAHRMSACSLSVVLAAVAGQAPCGAGVLVEKNLVETERGALNTLNAFGLTHTATGNSQLALSPTGALMVTNIGSSGLDGVSFAIGCGRGHSMSMDMGEMGLLAPGGEVAVFYPYAFGERCVYVRGDAGGGATLGVREPSNDAKSYQITLLDDSVVVGQIAFPSFAGVALGNGLDLVAGDMGTDPISGEGVRVRTETTEWGYRHTLRLPVDSVLELLDENGIGTGGVLADEVRIEVIGLPPGQLLGDGPGGATNVPVRVIATDLGQSLQIREHVLLASGVRSHDDGGIRDFHWTQTSGPFKARGGALFSGADLDQIVTPFTDVTDPLWRNPNNPQAGVVVSNIGSSGLDGVEVDFAIQNVCPDYAPYKCPDGRCAQSAADCPRFIVEPQLLRLNNATNPMAGGVIPVNAGLYEFELVTADSSGLTTWTGGRATLASDPATGGQEIRIDANATGGSNVTVELFDDGILRAAHTEAMQPSNVMARMGNHPNVCQFVGLVPAHNPLNKPAYQFAFSGDMTVQIGGVPFVGDEIRVSVNDSPMVLSSRATMRMTAANVGPFIAEMKSDEQPDDVVMVLGTRGQPRGGAIFASQNDSLRVSNIGSSGQDGVSLDFEEATGFALPIEEGGEFTPQSSFAVDYWQTGDWCPSVAPAHMFGLSARAITPDQVVVSVSEFDPAALVDVTLRDASGSEVGSFTMDQSQSFLVAGPGNGQVTMGTITVASKKMPGNLHTLMNTPYRVCYSVNGIDWTANGQTGGGVTVTFGQGVPTTDVTNIEFCPKTDRPPFRGHVTVLKAHDPGGTTGTPGDMVFGPTTKKGYDYYQAQSDAGLRSGVVSTGPGDSSYLVNGIKENEEGFGHDLAAENINQNPLADPISHISMGVSGVTADGGPGDLRVKFVVKKSPASGGGAVWLQSAFTQSPVGIDQSLSIDDDNGAVYIYRASISLFDELGNLLAFEDGSALPDSVNATCCLTLTVRPIRIECPAVAGGPGSGGGGPVTDSLTQAWAEPTVVTLGRTGQTVPGVKSALIEFAPVQPLSVDLEDWSEVQVLGSAPAGETMMLRLDEMIVEYAPPCLADTNGDGLLDNGDIATFITLFLAQDPAVDFNDDGVIDNGDIAAFIAAFLAGC